MSVRGALGLTILYTAWTVAVVIGYLVCGVLLSSSAVGAAPAFWIFGFCAVGALIALPAIVFTKLRGM